jgi:hypothetical protein
MSSVLVDVRTAVGAAWNYVQQLVDLLLEPGQKIEGLRLEEAELSEDKQYWSITLGFDRPIARHRDLLSQYDLNPKYEREYRIFKVNAQTGEVQAMKIREL